MMCAEVENRLDVYMDRELDPIAVNEIAHHLEGCAACSGKLSQRAAFRSRLRAAARNVPGSADLRRRVRAQIGSEDRTPRAWSWRTITVAAAIVLALGVFSWHTGQDRYIARVEDRLSPIMRVGLRDHIHCAVFRAYLFRPPSPAEMTRQLGPAYSALLPVVEAHVPSGFRVVLAHRCSYKGRNYVHLIARGGDRLISLVITKRGEGEAFERDLRAVASESDLSVYSSDARPYNIAGFATTGFLVYLVSDLGEKPNLAALEALAPAVRRVLL